MRSDRLRLPEEKKPSSKNSKTRALWTSVRHGDLKYSIQNLGPTRACQSLSPRPRISGGRNAVLSIAARCSSLVSAAGAITSTMYQTVSSASRLLLLLAPSSRACLNRMKMLIPPLIAPSFVVPNILPRPLRRRSNYKRQTSIRPVARQGRRNVLEILYFPHFPPPPPTAI